ncbi:MAG: hypothetical protein RIB58_00885 [Phycisphaerales bacterium]|jgi:hypothetical protein
MDEPPPEAATRSAGQPEAAAASPNAARRDDPELPARLRAVQVRTGDLVRLRIIFIALVRLGGLLMATSSMIPFGSWLAEGISDGDLWWFSYYWPRIGVGALLIVLGGSMLLFGGVLGRALVRGRVGSVVCPMCKFELTMLDRGRCTECGYEVNPALPELGVPPLERVLAARMFAFALLRLLGLVFVGLAGLQFAAFLLQTYVPEVFSGYWHDEYQGFLSLLRAGGYTGVAAVLFFGAPLLSAVLVPMAWAGKLSASRLADRPDTARP